jgi:hypothetical protein
MKAKLLLRIASGAMLFHLLGHSVGNATWTQTTDPVKQEVINAMTNHDFPFMGAMRSMGDYYSGYGYCVSIALLFFAVVLWLFSGAVKENIALVYKLLVATTFFLFAWSIDEFIFFFPFAACTTLLAALLTTIAAIQLKKQRV